MLKFLIKEFWRQDAHGFYKKNIYSLWSKNQMLNFPNDEYYFSVFVLS